MLPPIVQAKNLSFFYSNQNVLDNVNLDIYPDDFLAIIGPNGGGKSTFLKIMLGLLKPKSGSMTVFGTTPEKGRNHIGYMPQFKAQTQHYPISVLDVVLMGCLSQKMITWYTKANKQKALESLCAVQAEALVDRPFMALSGGQQQRVLLARALMSNPKLLVLDEPTCSIDQPTGQHFFELLTEMSKTIAIVMVSHDLAAVSHSAKKIVCLNKTITTEEGHNAYCRHDDFN